jgi:hypothetical protein
MSAEDGKPLQGSWEDGTWKGARRWQMTAAMRATPEQRLAWLEEMIEIAHLSGAARQRLEETAPSPALSDEPREGGDSRS